MADNDVVVDAFTELAPRYEETMDRELREFWGLGYREFIDRLIEAASIEEGYIVLDVATGTAIIPLQLVDRLGVSGRVVGLDITPAMLRHGRKNIATSGLLSPICLVCASAMAMPFSEGVFDVVICGLGTHHMDVPQMLAEVRRVLKGGGKLVIADVGASAFWRSFWGGALLKILLLRYGLMQGTARARAEVAAFPSVRTADEWQTVLLDSSFSEIEITEFRSRRPWYPCGLTIRAIAGAGRSVAADRGVWNG